MLKTILNLGQILTVIQVINWQALTEKQKSIPPKKIKLLEQQCDAVKSIILSDAQDEYENKQPFEFP